MKHTVTVAVLGRHYTIRSSATPEDVRRVAELVNSKIAEAAGGQPADTLGQAVLALLNLGGAYLRLCDEARSKSEIEKRLVLLLERLDATLPHPPGA